LARKKERKTEETGKKKPLSFAHQPKTRETEVRSRYLGSELLKVRKEGRTEAAECQKRGGVSNLKKNGKSSVTREGFWGWGGGRLKRGTGKIGKKSRRHIKRLTT